MVAIHHPAEHHRNGRSMLTTSEVAHLLGAHINSVRRWADMGLLPSYRIGLRGDRRFEPDAISSFLVSQE
jgi:excisionase family DNA binding protein